MSKKEKLQTALLNAFFATPQRKELISTPT
jgi:hypothetical protein